MTGHAEPEPETPLQQQSSALENFSAARQRLLRMHPEDEDGRMLRAPALKTGGKVYGFATADEVVIKLSSARVRELIEAGRGLACSPRPGRPMREWVRVTPPHDEACLSYLLEARSFVSAAT